jgi:protocatechuate 3,4-dioxygenase alpha subunit
LRTPSQTVGPFFTIGLCRRPENELDSGGVELAGRLLDGQGQPIPDGMIELWEPVGRRWARCGTDGEGRFRFLVARDARRLEASVFARGLLRHQLTRVYLDDAVGAEDETLVAERDGDAFRFDIRMQGDRATLFFAH